METILIFAGGQRPGLELIDDLPVPDSVIAADSGYDVAVALGYQVDVLVGDLDSVQAEVIPRHVMVHRHPSNKDATDLELALDLAVGEGPDRIVVAGGAGGRVDHELATAQLLCSPSWAGVEIDWLSGRGRAHVVTSHRLIHGDVGTTLTLLAIGGPATDVRTKGLEWNLEGEKLEPGSTRGVSNVLSSPVADIRVGEGSLLAVLPVD